MTSLYRYVSLVINVASTIINFGNAFSVDTAPCNSLVFPIKQPYIEGAELPSSAFDALIDSSDFMESSSETSSVHQASSCLMECFGKKASVTFQKRTSTFDANGPTEYILFAFDFDRPIDDFGMLCLELYRHKEHIQNVVDCRGLEANVLDYMNSQPPCPGADAELTSSETIGSKRFGDVLDRLDSDALSKLQHEGYVVIDTGMHSSSTDKLNELANKSKTGQETSRTDTVAFLNRKDAVECDLEDEYDFLLTIAGYLNDNFDLYASPYKPILPATKDKPLTNPFNVQMAEYGWKDYYNAHSDNSIDMRVRSNGVFEDCGTTISDDYILSDYDKVLPKKRSNYRCITAILYLNENWEKSDGGQLRMYLDSGAVERPNTAADTHDYVDINPSNGKLLLFDSRMVHSVEEVLNKYKIRRALTLWITRPEESGVSGEDYFINS